ncbi:hypothetical protein [Luteimonas sp. A478]
MSQPLVNFISALLTPTVAVAALYLGYHQYRVERLIAKQSLYSHRLSVYIAAANYAGSLARDQRWDPEAEQRMRSAAAEAAFLFREDVAAALAEVLTRGVNIRINQTLISETSPEQGPRLRQLIQDDQSWLSQAERRLFDLFKPYLSLGRGDA